jgi:shikimate kinase
MAPLLVFVGAPGAGKSTIAAEVARRLNTTHLDTDAIVEQRAGMTVSDIFVTQGEPAFRTQERSAVVEALSTDGTVVSLGGGAVIDAATRADLKQHRVAWLQVSLSDAATRAGLNQARPLLLGNIRATLAKLLDERTPWYAEVATKPFDTSAAHQEKCVDAVMSWLHECGVSEGAA